MVELWWSCNSGAMEELYQYAVEVHRMLYVYTMHWYASPLQIWLNYGEITVEIR